MELKSDLERAGFVNRGGWNWPTAMEYPSHRRPLVVASPGKSRNNVLQQNDHKDNLALCVA